MSDSGVSAAVTGSGLVIAASGRWTIQRAAALDLALRAIDPGRSREARFDLSGVEALDSAGAWLIERTRGTLADKGLSVSLDGLPAAFAPLFGRVERLGRPAPLPPPPPHRLSDVLARIGETTFVVGRRVRDLLEFFGAVLVTLARSMAQPRRIRFVSLISHIEQVGLNALPIVGLLSFLIGVVLAFQGIDQLSKFGAEVFTVNLVGISVLREMGVVLTAVVIAGRSGSAFTAQIGTMQVNEEVDAMRTLGLDPIEVLVLPRILALIIALPLLTFFANFVAIFGAALMLLVLIDLSIPSFLTQMNQAVTLTTFWIGLGKAPVFAFLIALVGCFEGLQVRGSAESVGRLTTLSVVESIFLVIVFDALFSVIFSYLGI
jgi:phospholipid/cholesterol/gamma-HCH transport system permease protein